jgi:hypothetical protein
MCKGWAGATHEQMRNYELIGRGTGISFPELDVDLYVPALIEGVYGNRRWMAQLGKKGGSAKTEAKRRCGKSKRRQGRKTGESRGSLRLTKVVLSRDSTAPQPYSTTPTLYRFSGILTISEVIVFSPATRI